MKILVQKRGQKVVKAVSHEVRATTAFWARQNDLQRQRVALKDIREAFKALG